MPPRPVVWFWMGIVSRPLNKSGDGYVQDGHHHLVKAAATDTNGDVWHLGRFPAVPSPGDTLILLNFTKALATIFSHPGAKAAA
jgi:hypothetical protein